MGAFSSSFSTAYDAAPAVPVWDPSLPWPGTEGGATSPHWGGYVRLYVRAQIVAGTTFHLGEHDADRLDAGNVMGAAGAVALDVTDGGAFSPAYSSAFDTGPAAALDRLWADLSCDVLDVQLQSGASAAAGILTAVDAATCEVVLADPLGIYDPATAQPPFVYGGRSRLVPGVPVEVFAEVVDPYTADVSVHYLFTGTADSWSEDWTVRGATRRAVLRATDATKMWARYDRPEAFPRGDGDTTAQRVQRLVTYYSWPGAIEPGASSAVTFQATTLVETGWEQLGDTLGAELGVVYFTPEGALRWTSRSEWFTPAVPVVTLGCDAWDVLIDATPSSADNTVRNVVRATRTDGATQTAQSTASVVEFGAYEFSQTDLPVQTDTQAGQWARDVLTVSAYPRIVLEDVTMAPAIAAASWDLWPVVLGVRFVTDGVRVIWSPPDLPDAPTIDTTTRVVGVSHAITRAAWEVQWQLSGTDALAGADIFTLGPHAHDRLNAGYVLAAA